MNINNVLPAEKTLSVFKILDSKQVPIAREVCKDWLKLIDGNKTFWRILELPQTTVEVAETVVKQFDQKSGSTLEEVSMVISKWEAKPDASELSQVLQQSEKTLHILSANSSSKGIFRSFDKFSGSLLRGLPNLVDFRAARQGYDPRVRLLRSQKESGSLQILWIDSLKLPSPKYLHITQPHLFKMLVSLSITQRTNRSKIRGDLLPSVQSLRHLDIRLQVIEQTEV